MGQADISWAHPHYWGSELQYVADAMASTWISGGSYIDRFELGFAEFCRSPHAITTSNGTTALHLAYLALNIGPGDEIIVPGFGFMAAANVALHVGAKPVFCEVSPDSWCLTAESVESCITEKTKAIVAIHTYGNVCDMDPIFELAQAKGVMVIEDAAEAIGSEYLGKVAGAMASIGIFSFHATKTISMGEGGAVVTKDANLRDRMKLIRSHGMSPKRYWHEVAGHNFRLSNLHAAMGCAQLEKFETIARERARVYKTYKNQLESAPGVTLQHYSDKVDPVVWAIAVAIDEKAYPQGRDAVMTKMKKEGIETRPGFYSADTMPHIYGSMELPICNRLSRQIISFPSSPTLTEGQIKYVCESLKATSTSSFA